MMIYLFLCSAITGALKGNNSPVLPIMMTCFFIYSAITGALKIGIQDLSFRGRLRAWWERLVFDYNIKSEQWKIKLGFLYLRILQFLGRAPSMEQIKYVIDTEEKRFVDD